MIKILNPCHHQENIITVWDKLIESYTVQMKTITAIDNSITQTPNCLDGTFSICVSLAVEIFLKFHFILHHSSPRFSSHSYAVKLAVSQEETTIHSWNKTNHETIHALSDSNPLTNFNFTSLELTLLAMIMNVNLICGFIWMKLWNVVYRHHQSGRSKQCNATQR